MGLDMVEYVMAVEDAFQIAIPHADAVQLTTPHQLIDYVCARVDMRDDNPPLLQATFYRLRQSIVAALGVPRRSVHPETCIADLTDRVEDDVWNTVAVLLGVPVKTLTHAPVPQWLTNFTRAPRRTIGAVARQIAMLRPAALKPSHRGWTREEVTEVAVRLLEFELGIPIGTELMNATFVRGLGMG